MSTPSVLPIIPLNTQGQELTPVDEVSVSSISVTSKYNVDTDYIKAYLYDINDNLIGGLTTNYSITSGKISGSTSTQINLDPAQDLASNNYTQGTYKVNYNFLSSLISGAPSFNITETSSDRTELRVSNSSLSSSELQAVATTLTNFLNSTETFQGFDLDFGNDIILLVTNVGFDGTAILIKLYQPLPTNLGLRSSFFFVEKKSEPVAFILEYPQEELEAPEQIFLKGPNLNIQLQQESNTSTGFQTLDSIYSSSDIDLTNQLNSILVERRAELNTDYSDFINFIFFSSAEQRLINFYDKASLIENYNNQIASLNTIANTTEASSSKAIYQTKINDLITNFDGYDYYLYFDSSSQSWPKSNSTPPYTLYSTGSTEVLTWYSELLDSGSLYDERNPNYIYNIYPQYITEDTDNDQFKLFNEMVAQMFDQIWLYTQAIENRQDGDNRLSEGISIDLAADALRSYGITLYESNLSNNDLYTTYLGINPAGGTLPPTGSELITNYVTASAETTPFNDAQKLVYKRLYHNLPYLLKKKGTVAGLQLLIDCFGVPDTILRINEFGGKDKNPRTWDQWQNSFDYSFYATGSTFVSSSWALNTLWNSLDDVPQAVEFRFKTDGLPTNTATITSQSLWTTDTGVGTGVGVALRYNGSGYTSGSYSGSVVNPYQKYGYLDFYPNIADSSTTCSVYLPFFDGGWWSVMVNKDNGGSSTTFQLIAKNNIYTGADSNILGFQASASVVGNDGDWNSTQQSYLATSSLAGPAFTGSLQEWRYYATQSSQDTFDAYVMNPASIEQSQYLVFRATLGGELYTGSSSVHPKVSGVQAATSSFASTSNFYYKGTPLFVPNNEVVFYDQVLGGIKNIVSNKVKLGESTVYGKVLSGLASLQQNYPASQSYTSDVNYMEVGFSPANEINEDINSQFGYINIGEYIGDPRFISQSSYTYPELNTLSFDYFKKYGSSYDLQDYFRLIKYFDNSLFKMIKDFVPARASVATGAIVKQHLLERNRQRPAQIDYTQPEYTGSVTSLARDYQTGSIEVFTGGAGGSVNVLTNISQSWTSSILTKAGLVTGIESSQYEFFNGEYSGSSINTINNKLQDNPLLGAAYRISIPDQQNLNVVRSTNYSGISASFNSPMSGTLPFDVEVKPIDTYNNTTYLYTPLYPVQSDIEVFITGAFLNTTSVEDSQLTIYVKENDNIIATGFDDNANDGNLTLRILIPNYAIKSGATYRVDYLYRENDNVSPSTARIDTGSYWTVTVDNLAAQSTYYLDPTVYTQQNFPGDINDFSDYNTLLNNVYSNRVSTLYYDVDYSTNALNPVNFSSIISQSALYAQVQDSNYTKDTVWVNSRYDGVKNTGLYNTSINFSTSSQAPGYPIDKFTNYFARFTSNTSSDPEYPGGGLFKLVELINIDGTRIPLTGDNQYVDFVSQIFKAGKTVTAYGRDISVVKTVTNLSVIEGGALYSTVVTVTGSQSPIVISETTSGNGEAFEIYFSTSSVSTLTDRDFYLAYNRSWIYTFTNPSSSEGIVDYFYFTSSLGSHPGVSFYNKSTGGYINYATPTAIIDYADTYLPLQYGDLIRFGKLGSYNSSNTSSLDGTFTAGGLFQILNITTGSDNNVSSSINIAPILTQYPFSQRVALTSKNLQNFRIIRRVPDETWVTTATNPSINTDPAIGGFLIPEDFNPNYNPILVARSIGIEL
jgi:hypothetical protein